MVTHGDTEPLVRASPYCGLQSKPLNLSCPTFRHHATLSQRLVRETLLCLSLNREEAPVFILCRVYGTPSKQPTLILGP